MNSRKRLKRLSAQAWWRAKHPSVRWNPKMTVEFFTVTNRFIDVLRGDGAPYNGPPLLSGVLGMIGR